MKRSRNQNTNPLHKAFHSFLSDYVSAVTEESSIDFSTLISSIPKRYTLYPPLLLLPPNAFSATPTWTAFTSQLSTQSLQVLYHSIIEAFKSQGITHIAHNSPISPTTHHGTSNIIRSPTGLVPLYGDFGPRNLLSDKHCPPVQPSDVDFSAAFWVHTAQNGGIFQTWAPLWTMFSRGNVSEKARILGEGTFQGLDGAEGVLGQGLREIAVVDMYVGIGYFAFSYLKRGVGRVFGWEINGWSVEGLKRGCGKNGWGVRVLRVGEAGLVHDEEGRSGDEVLGRLVGELGKDKDLRLVAFQGDNRWARNIMGKIRVLSEKTAGSEGASSWLEIRHINLGLLPSSRLSWEDAAHMLDGNRVGWVHVHENVDIREMNQKKDFVVQCFQAHLGGSRQASCSHIEQVKTYAPGVMHCVFDVHIEPKATSHAGDQNG